MRDAGSAVVLGLLIVGLIQANPVFAGPGGGGGGPPSTPFGLSVPATDEDGNYTINWGPSNGDFYMLQIKVGSGSWTDYDLEVTNHKDVTNQSEGTYSYRVKACNSPTNCSGYSNTDTIVVNYPPPVPTGLTAPSVDHNGSYTISWNSSTTATLYKLEQRLNSGPWGQIHSASSTSKAVSGNSPGTYQYRVRACEGSTPCSTWSSIRTVLVEAAPATPTGLSGPSVDYNGSYSANWNSSARSTSYQLQQKQGSGSWSQIYSGGGTAHAISNNNPGTWYYQVRGCNVESVCSTWSSTASVVVEEPPAVPSGLTGPGTDHNGSYTVSWGSSARSTSYLLEQRLGSGTWSPVYSGSSTSSAISGNGAGSWSYRVSGCNAESECSTWSSTETVVVEAPPAVPTGLNGPTTDYNGSYSVSWTASARSTSYALQQRLGSDPWEPVYSGGGTTEAISGNSPGTWHYQVSGCNVESVCSGWSATTTVTVPEPPAAPTSLTGPAASTNGAYTISWNTVSGASTYRLEEKAGSGAWGQIYSGSPASNAISGKNAGTTYSYRVQSCNPESVCGNWSATHSVIVGHWTTFEYDDLGRVIRRTPTQ